MSGMEIQEIKELSSDEVFWIKAPQFKYDLTVDEWNREDVFEATEVEETDVVGIDFPYQQRWRFEIDENRGVVRCYSFSPPMLEDEVGDESRYENESPNMTCEVYPKAFREGEGP